VTIAAGFRFNTGILLCADTRWTSKAKTETTKIFTISHHGATVILALTGREIFAKRAVGRITENIREIPENELSKNKMQDKIELALREVFNNHIYTHPDWGTNNAPGFDFVIGMYSPIDGDFLMASDETLTAVMAANVCLGSGTYLGDYLSRMYIGKNQTLSEVTALAIYVLQQVKSYDADCGGGSEFIVLWDDGTMSEVGRLDIFLGENYSTVFQRAITPLFYAVSDPEKKDEEAQAGIDEAIKLLKAHRVIRATMKKTGEQQAALMRELLKRKKPI
jgi:20S proteasome alpha/beta subunit